MDDERLKELERKYMQGDTETGDLENFDLDAHLKQLEETGGRDFSDLAKEFGIEGLDLDRHRVGTDIDLDNIDQMLKDLNLGTEATAAKDLVESAISTLGKSADYDDNRPKTPPRESKSVYNIMLDTVPQKKDSFVKDSMSKDANAPLSRDEKTPQDFQVDSKGNSMLMSPSNGKRVLPPNNTVKRQTENKGSDRPTPNNESEYRKASADSEKIKPFSAKHSEQPSKSLTVNPSGGSSRQQEPIKFSEEETRKPSVDFKQGLFKADEVSETEEDLSVPAQHKKRRMSFDDNWIDELEKKIRYNEVDHIYSKTKIDTQQVLEMAAERNKGIRKKEEIVMEKGKEFRLDSQKTSNFKILLDKFDEMEIKNIKEIKAPKEGSFYSALKEAAWNSEGLSAVTFDKCQNVQDMVKGQFTGNLTCFAFSEDLKSLLVVGTDTGEVIELDLMQKKVRKQKVDSKVLSLDISPDKERWAAGLENGDIYVKKTYGSWTNKRSKMDERPINQVRFSGNDFVVCATDFNVYRVKILDLKLMYDLTKLFVFQNSPDVITQIHVVFADEVYKVIVTTIRSVKMYSFTEESGEEEFTLEKPPYVKEGAVPSVSWLSPDDKAISYIMVFWDTFVLLIQDEPGNAMICAMKQLKQRLIWGTVLRNRVICTIYEDFEIRLDSIQSIFVNLLSGGGFDYNFKLTKSEYIKGRNLGVTPDGFITQAYSESIRCYGNNIYLLKSIGMYKIYLLTLKEMCISYSDRGDWLHAFKLCVDVYNNRIRANEDEKIQMRHEIIHLSNTYVDRFLDKSKKSNDVQSQITRICIDAMINTGNLNYLFDTMRHKFDDISFWREVEVFIECGMITSIPISSLKEGGLYLSSESLQYLVYQYTYEELMQDEDQYNQLLMMLKRRKLWCSLYRLGLLHVDTTLGLVLSSMLADLMTVVNNSDIRTYIDTCSELDSKVHAYIRIYWYLHRIVTGYIQPMIDTCSNIDNVWIKTIEWLVDPSNVKVLSTSHISMYLEIYFELFLNNDYTSSTTVNDILLSNIHISSIDSSIDNSIDSSIQVYTSIIHILYKYIDSKYTQDISFLCIKLLTLNIHRHITSNYILMYNIIYTLLSTIYVYNRLWFHYELILIDDYEEQVIRLLTLLKHTSIVSNNIHVLLDISYTNKYYRVYSYLIEVSKGIVESLNTYVSLVDYGNATYLYNWIKKCLTDKSNESSRLEYSRQLIKHLDYLIGKSKVKAKEIIVLIPNVGVEAIDSLDVYPDLQINYLESLLESEVNSTSTNAKLSSDLRLKYLLRLCEYRPSNVYPALISFDFPLDESLELAERFKVPDAVAYLKHKLGREHDALKDFEMIFMYELENMKIKDLTSLLKLMKHERNFANNELIIMIQDIIAEKVSLITKLKLGRVLSNNCSICDARIKPPFLINPQPCPHTLHLECAAQVAQQPKDYFCLKCAPFISLDKRVTASLSEYPQVDLRKAWRDYKDKQDEDEQNNGDPELTKLSVMLDYEDFCSSQSNEFEKCAMLVQSDQAARLLEEQYSKKKIIRV